MIASLIAMWKAMPEFIKAILLAAIVWLVAHHLGYVSGYSAGVKHEKDAQAAAIAKAQKQVDKTNAAAQDITDKAEAKNTEAQVKIQTQTKEIIRYVPQILPDRGYYIRNGFVCLHDAAASGDMSRAAQAACGPDDSTSTVTDTQAITVIAENYGECRADQERLTQLQAWNKSQYDLLSAAAKKQ